jgi:SRSO17 transposase
MAGRTLDWRAELGQFLKPFLDRLGHKARREMCPLYVSGLIGPGDRKSIAPMAKRLALGECDQLHHFIAAGVWDATPVETELLVQADRLVGGSDAVLVIDDTAIPRVRIQWASLRNMLRRWGRPRRISTSPPDSWQPPRIPSSSA